MPSEGLVRNVNKGTSMPNSGMTGRWASVAAMIAVAGLLGLAGGCNRSPAEVAEEAKQRNAELGGGPTAMWYRFTFAATYGKQPFRFDQYVLCGLHTVAGGPFGSTPSVTSRSMYPRTTGRRMADGSYIVIRIPDLCDTNRAIDAGGVKQVGWASRGPFEVLPMVIWNDRRPQTTIVEQYVARGYYKQPGARITNPRGSVELMPVGFHPANYEAVLEQPEWSTTDPDENTDPATGKRFRNVYASTGNGLVAFYTVPTVDMATALARFDEPPEKIAREVDVAGIDDLQTEAVNQTAIYLREAKRYMGLAENESIVLKPVKGPLDEAVSVYQDSERYEVEPFTYDPTYLPPHAIYGCLFNLRSGFPVLSNVPTDQDATAGLLNPRWVARAVVKAKAWRTRSNAACALLDRLVSYDIRNGRLDAAGAIPGAIVRRQWHQTNEPGKPSLLERAGVAYRFGREGLAGAYRFRLGSTNVDLRPDGPISILHDRANGRWLALFQDRDRIVGDRSVEGGW